MPEYDVVIKMSDALRVVSERMIIPTNDDVPGYLTPAIERVRAHIVQAGGQPLGPCMTRWHSSPDTLTNEDVEVVWSFKGEVSAGEGLAVFDLPVEEVASVIHQGDADEFTNGHKALLEWMTANNYELAGAYLEIYLDWADRSQSTTEVQFPIKKIS